VTLEDSVGRMEGVAAHPPEPQSRLASRYRSRLGYFRSYTTSGAVWSWVGKCLLPPGVRRASSASPHFSA